MSATGVRLGDKNPPCAVTVLGDHEGMAGPTVMEGLFRPGPVPSVRTASASARPQPPLASRGAEIRGKSTRDVRNERITLHRSRLTCNSCGPPGIPLASLERTTTMATQRTRREFLGNVGRGMLVASVGFGTAFDMGLTPAWADDEGAGERLAFGGLEPLVSLMQETPVRNLVPALVEKLRSGTELKELVAAAALANARTFGGEDYVGFHTLIALAPPYHM